MDNPLGIQSYSYRQMNRRIRQAIVSTQKMCEHRKDIPSTALIYKQYRQPIWRLNLYSINTDSNHNWPKSRKLVNILSDPYRSLCRNPFNDEGYSFTLPVTPDLRLTPKLPMKCLRPLRSARYRVSPPCIHRHSPPRLVVPPAAYRKNQTYQPSIARRDYSYLYDSRSNRISPDLDFKSSLLSRTSAYAYPIISGEMRNPRETTRLADRMFNTYANRSMELETSNNFQIHSRLAQHSSGYKYAQFSMTPRNDVGNYKIPLIIKHDRFKPKGPIDVRQVVTRFGKKTRPVFPDLDLYPEFPRAKYNRAYKDIYTNDYDLANYDFSRVDRRNKIPLVIKHDRFKPKGPVDVRQVVNRFGKKSRPLYPDLDLYPEFPRAKYHRAYTDLYHNDNEFESLQGLTRIDTRNKIPLVIKHDRFKPKGPVNVREVVTRFGKVHRPVFPDLDLYPEFPRAKYNRSCTDLCTKDYEYFDYFSGNDNRLKIPLVIKHDRFKPKGPVDVRQVVNLFGKKSKTFLPDLDLYPEFPRVKFHRPNPDDLGLRLRLNMKLSPSTMAHLYPNENLILSTLPNKPSKNRLKEIFDDEDILLNSQSSRNHYNNRKTTKSESYIARTSSGGRRAITNDYLYPSNPSQSSMRTFELRPLPGNNLKLKISRLAEKLSSKFDEDVSDEEVIQPLRTSANNYSQLYVAHPEFLSSTELGERIKLSLRSSTNKIASLYASHPVNSRLLPVPSRRKAHTSLTSSRIPDKYLPDSYVPRPGIVSALKVRP